MNDQRICVDQLRDLHRSLDLAAVIRAVSESPLPPGPQEKCLVALSLAQVGRTDQGLLQEAVSQIPDDNDPLWLSDVALACLLTGQGHRARQLLEKALESGQATSVEYGRMAAVCLSLNDLDSAGKFYREAVDREPGQGIWHNNLAGILVRQQKLDQALSHYEAAIRLKPDLEQAKNSRFQVLRALERTFEVVQEIEGELSQSPDDHLLRLRLARAYEQDGQFTAAVETLQQALVPVKEVEIPSEEEGKADSAWSWQIALRMELARIFASRSRHGLALLFLEQVLTLEPEDPVPCYALQATALSEMGQYDAALEVLDKGREAARKNSADVGGAGESLFLEYQLLSLDIARASVLGEKGKYNDAEEILRRLLETYPGNPQLLSHLGQTLLWTGKLFEAGDYFEQASRINPMALAQMVDASRLPEDPEVLLTMRRMADNPLVPEPSRIAMGFALAEVYDKKRETDNAWHYLSMANRLTDRQISYRPKDFSRKVDCFKKVFTRAFFAGQPGIRASDRTPVFVVGMPRSGTTLTEQILCSHEAIFGAGELDLMGHLVQLMPRVFNDKRPFPVCLDQFTPHLREEAARFYLHGLETYDTDHAYVVDKMPHNFMLLGLIALIFPKAKIIHVQRDPRDTALSNFQQNFKARNGGLGYAFNLEHIALQINDYNRMMAHWRKVLPIPMFEFRYEDLVSDQETWSRKLLEFVGVDWDEAVRSFYRTERAVRTASVTQVRKPIYKTSRQKWRRYEKYLSPLLSILESGNMTELI